MSRMPMIEAAKQLARDRVLADPTDDAIILATAELALGKWPVEGIDREMCERILDAYNAEDDLWH